MTLYIQDKDGKRTKLGEVRRTGQKYVAVVSLKKMKNPRVKNQNIQIKIVATRAVLEMAKKAIEDFWFLHEIPVED